MVFGGTNPDVKLRTVTVESIKVTESINIWCKNQIVIIRYELYQAPALNTLVKVCAIYVSIVILRADASDTHNEYRRRYKMSDRDISIGF